MQHAVRVLMAHRGAGGVRGTGVFCPFAVSITMGCGLQHCPLGACPSLSFQRRSEERTTFLVGVSKECTSSSPKIRPSYQWVMSFTLEE